MMKKYVLFLFIPVTLVLLCVFFFLLGKNASADSGKSGEMSGYESILIKDGDTLSSIADTFAPEYSHFNNHEYMEAIISLNSLSSEYIKAGSYLLLPVYI